MKRTFMVIACTSLEENIDEEKNESNDISVRGFDGINEEERDPRM